MKELQEFAIWVLEHSFKGGDIKGYDAQDKAYELGLLNRKPYNPEVDCVPKYADTMEQGQYYYFHSDKLKQCLNDIIAGELEDVIIDLTIKYKNANTGIRNMLVDIKKREMKLRGKL